MKPIPHKIRRREKLNVYSAPVYKLVENISPRTLTLIDLRRFSIEDILQLLLKLRS
jgi:hypothetical protein